MSRCIWLCLASLGCAKDATEPATDRGCNGHADLCDRPIDAVTFAGTHNSMANADAGWMAPNQQHGITQQLTDGIRAMMLDTTEWEGEPYLCHGYCELGAQPLADGLGEIEEFLQNNPRDVVLIVFQDGLSIDEMVASLDASGLADRAWEWGDDLPTLGGLIDEETNLIVTSEHHSPPPGWYHHAWELIQDTPYSFASADEMSCEAFRGSTDSPLFMMNHWLSTPLPTETGAMEVNASAVLGARTERCTQERNRHVNIVAVDFYNHGDLFEVVDGLNGITP